MKNISKSLEQLEKFVGNTPTIRLKCRVDDKEVIIFAKYEAWNFSGSIKDRMALQILKSGYELGIISESDTIVEATSGNTGIAFAAMGAFLGQRVQIYMPDWMSEERKRLLKFYGAHLIEVSKESGGFLKCIELANKKGQKKGFFCPKQFENTWNVLAHQQTTAPELQQTLKKHNFGDLDMFATGVGTGGTVMGFYHYFNSYHHNNDSFHVFPILPDKNEDGKHRIEGIGDSFIPKILDLTVLGPILRVKDTDAINISRQMNKLGLSVGISSGANVFGSLVQSQKLKGFKSIGTILCDDNRKYLTTDLCSDTEESLSRDVEIIDYDLFS